MRFFSQFAGGLVLLASTFSFTQTVTIVSPREGATTSPVRVVANFSDIGSIAATTVLVDGAAVMQGGAVTPLDVTIPISPGNHEITVTAVNDDGRESSASTAVDISAPDAMMAEATVGSATTGSSGSHTVTITGPSDGATVGSPFDVHATYGATAKFMKLWVDYSPSTTESNTNAFDKQVSLSSGAHRITVQAMDSSTGQVYADTVNINVGSTSSSTSTGSTATFSKIEEKSGWYTAPDQGSPDCSSKPTLTKTPSIDGISGKFYLGPNGQFNNCLWPILLGKSTTATHFQLDVHYQLSNPAYPQGVEFSSNKHVGTKWYKFSVQCSYNKGVFSVFDPVADGWVSTGIACIRPSAGKWDHLIVNSEISNGKSLFTSIVFNGVTHTINKSVGPISKPSSYNFGVHFQMDGNRAGNAYYTWVDQFTYKVW
ncbi:MAG TPA: Ig-like domain-containing protein [Terriglobales bacterium]|nr:Ig-like domain-containing protein [Terriglobales bacterium]